MQEAERQDPNRELLYINVVTLHIATPGFFTTAANYSSQHYQIIYQSKQQKM